jgi:tRNA(Met) C34 N-acetyltransferase TmcA
VIAQSAEYWLRKQQTLSKRSIQHRDMLHVQVSRCRTLDQAHALVTFLDAASEKTLRSTLALTASRGRGKSAALGLAIAGEQHGWRCMQFGCSNLDIG